MSITYLSLGSNLGNRELHLLHAKTNIQQTIGNIVAESSLYESEAVGFDGNPFLNQVIRVETPFSPETLLQITEAIEKQMGRTRKTIVTDKIPYYTNRIIDIDILLYDDLHVDTETLTIPHPKMQTRDFVMKPLAEIWAIF